MKQLLYREFLIQNKIYSLTKYTILFFGFCIVSTSVVNAPDDIQKFGLIFSVIYIPLAFLGLASNLIKPEMDDGSLEYLLVSTSALKVILAKFLILAGNTIFSFVLILPFIKIFFNTSVNELPVIALIAILLIAISSALIILIASIQSYFKYNTNFLVILVMPLVIPHIILSGILIQNHQEIYLLVIMLGINLVIIPPVIYLAGYLINNIYDI
jgi:heme exporter protein B